MQCQCTAWIVQSGRCVYCVCAVCYAHAGTCADLAECGHCLAHGHRDMVTWLRQASEVCSRLPRSGGLIDGRCCQALVSGVHEILFTLHQAPVFTANDCMMHASQSHVCTLTAHTHVHMHMPTCTTHAHAYVHGMDTRKHKYKCNTTWHDTHARV